MKYSLIVPCFNESGNIIPLLNRAKKEFIKKKIELIIVDNGSIDDTRKILNDCLKEYPFLRIKTLNKNLGYGGGIIEGLKLSDGELVGWTHADMQTDPLDFLKTIEIYKKNNYQNIFIKGKRLNRKLVDKFFTFWMSIFESILMRKIMYDINAQPTVFTRSFFESWDNPPKDFSLDLFAYYFAKKKNYKIVRFPVIFAKRLYGQSKWNIDIYSKLRFIIRTINYSFKLVFSLN